jgi:hypothetical protein
MRNLRNRSFVVRGSYIRSGVRFKCEALFSGLIASVASRAASISAPISIFSACRRRTAGDSDQLAGVHRPACE